MGEKDIVEKSLFDYDDVYVDIIRGLLGIYNKYCDKVERLGVTSGFRAGDGTIHEQIRDIFKVIKKDNVRIAAIGIENQSGIDYDMPLRIISYDGEAYKSQLLEGEDNFYPIITIVLNFSDKRWTGPKSLSEKIKVPPILQPYFSDYKVNVFDVSYFTDEQLEVFESDFRVVADFFVQVKRTGKYIPTSVKIVHKQEFLMLMSILSEDSRFTDVEFKEGGTGDMCEVIDNYIRIGEKTGEKRGYISGEKHGLLVGIRILLEDGYSISQIAKRIDMKEEEVEKLINSECLC